VEELKRVHLRPLVSGDFIIDGIAKIMGCSVSTTKSRFRLGVNQLKKLMENDYER